MFVGVSSYPSVDLECTEAKVEDDLPDDPFVSFFRDSSFSLSSSAILPIG
jgi:hypothetical protein